MNDLDSTICEKQASNESQMPVEYHKNDRVTFYQRYINRKELFFNLCLQTTSNPVTKTGITKSGASPQQQRVN